MTTMTDEMVLLPPDQKIDLVDIFFRFLRRLPIFLAIACVIMAGVVAFTLTQTPLYTGTASVVFEPRQTQVVKETPVVSELPADSAAIDTEAATLNSEEVAERVVRRLQLHRDPEFSDAIDPTAPAKVMTPAEEAEAIKDTALTVQGKTKVARQGATYVLDVNFTSLDPIKAARIANAIVEQYVASQIETNTDATRGANLWLRSRLEALQNELQANEAAVQQFKIANNLMSAQGATMAEQEVSSLNQQIATASADLAEKRARLSAARAQISRGGGGADTQVALDSPVVKSLRGDQAQIELALADMNERYGPLHPEVKKLQQRQREVEVQINNEIRRQISGLEAEVRIAEQRTASLQASRGGAEGSLGTNTRSQVALNELQRKADASRAVYEAFLSRANETSAQEGLLRPDARVAAWAQPPGKPSVPNKPLNFALGLVMALVGGAGAVLLLETLDGTLHTSAEVEAKLKMPAIGSVPHLVKVHPDRMGRYVMDKPFSIFAEAFRSLKSSIWSSTKGLSSRIVAISSALPGEGKTLTTLSFGRSLARGGAKTLIIDADLRRRMLTVAMRRQVENGLVEVLEGYCSLDEAIVQDEVSNAHVLLLSDNPPPSTDLFNGPALGELFEQLKARFDIVVLDTAPVLAIADTRAIAAQADATIFLVRWAKTPRQAARSALDLLSGAGAYVAGVCLTNVDLAKQARVGYGDTLYYHDSFRKYYAE
jgi:capsular exopolysaccharide synthesis family protein